MKILLIGEFSGLHNNLKEGLEAIGHTVTLAGTGDGFKNLAVDLNYDSQLPSIFGKLESYILPQLMRKKLSGYDVVQVINPFIFYRHRLPKFLNDAYYNIMFNFIKNNNGKLFLLACGSDGYYWRNNGRYLKYSPHQDEVNYDLGGQQHPLSKPSAYQFNKEFLTWFDGVIPTMYEYEISYAGEKKLLETVPMPINTDKMKFRQYKSGGSLKVFHGLNRYGFKGTRHIEAAFDFYSKSRSDIKFSIEGRMPLAEYLLIMDQMDIVLDQANSYSLGMNGLMAMAMGKSVLGGSEPEALACLGVPECPAVNILPNKYDIIEKLDLIFSGDFCLEENSLFSRKYVEKYHESKLIAKQFCKIWIEPARYRNQQRVLSAR